MQAVQGTYNNGIFTLNRQAPVKTGKIIVIFNTEETTTSDNENHSLQDLSLAPIKDEGSGCPFFGMFADGKISSEKFMAQKQIEKKLEL